MNYKYTNKALSNTIGITKNGLPLATIQFNSWKSEVNATLNGMSYIFRKKSFWSSDFLLFSADNETIEAEVVFKGWGNKTLITTKDKVKYFFNNSDFWTNKWLMENEQGEQIQFVKTTTFWHQEGEMLAKMNDSDQSDLLVLIGVFTLFLKRRRAAAAAAG